MKYVPKDLVAALESLYPEIALRIKFIWGDPVCSEYIRKLLIPEQSNYLEFPSDVFLALVELQEMHDLFFPSTTHRAPDLWNEISYARQI